MICFIIFYLALSNTLANSWAWAIFNIVCFRVRFLAFDRSKNTELTLSEMNSPTLSAITLVRDEIYSQREASVIAFYRGYWKIY